MTQEEKERLYSDAERLLSVYNEFSPVKDGKDFDKEATKNCILKMNEAAIENQSEREAFSAWMEESSFFTSPASTRFHGNFEGGLALHSLTVTRQALLVTKPFMENYFLSPAAQKYTEKYTVSASDIYISAIAHDFCKADVYKTEWHNTKDIFGNWKKTPVYKTKTDTRTLGHGNESVLRVLESIPSLIKRRPVLEAISRHMGFSDLSDSEGYNYTNFLDNPLVMLIQFADQSAAQWYDC